MSLGGGSTRRQPTGQVLSSGLSARTRGVAAQHASLSRWRSPVRIRSGPPVLFPGWEDVGITYWSGNRARTIAVAAILIAVAGLVVGFAAGLGALGRPSASPVQAALATDQPQPSGKPKP